MKLLIISDAWYPQVNGVVRTYEHLTEELEKMGHVVRVVGPLDFPWTLPMPGYSEIHLAVFPYRHLKKLIQNEQPDALHIAAEGPLGWAARKYCLRYDVDYTTSYHTHFPDYVAKRFSKHLPFLYRPVRRAAKGIIKHFHKHSKAMMVATPSLKQELESWGFKTPMHFLSRGVKLDIFYPGEKKLFKDLKRPIALYVGRVAIEKNLDDFLGMDWDGSKVIVGDGPGLKALQRRYPEAVFVGRKEGEDLAEHYRSADVFVFPSKTDTFGIVLIEALASGLPLAAYDVTGPRDIITKDFLGALDDNLPDAARLAMSRGTPEQRTSYVKSLYTWENAAKQFEAALLEK